MSLDDLYREVILDHYQNPRNRGELQDADAASHGHNPLCGDEVDVYLKLRDGTIADARFMSRGCSISQASASMMTESIKGRSLQRVESMLEAFKDVMLQDRTLDDWPEMVDLEALRGVRQYPVRVKCALLAWNTLKEALESYRAHQAQERRTGEA